MQSGGVSLYVLSCLIAPHVYTQEFINPDASIWRSMNFSNTPKCLVGVIYRNPTADTEFSNRMLESLSRSTHRGYTHILILGDFNLPKANFAEHTYIRGDNSTKARFSSFTKDLEVSENFKSATR